MFDKLKLFEHYLTKKDYITGFQRNDSLGYTAIALLKVKPNNKYEVVDSLFLYHTNNHQWKWHKLRLVK